MIITALVTPFNQDGSVNYPQFNFLLQRQVESGIEGVVIGGTTGENITISDDEFERLLAIGDNYANRIKVIANCGSNDTRHSLKLLEIVKRHNCFGIMLINPYYNKTNQSGLYLHFATIISQTPLPIILYNVPARTGGVIEVELIKKLAMEFSNIYGVKDAGCNLEYAIRIKKELPELALFSGNDNLFISYLGIGADGLISVGSNLIPDIFIKIEKAYQVNYLEGIKIFLDYFNLIQALGLETNPIPIKAAMNIIGLNVGGYRLPLNGMETKNLAALTLALKDSDLL